MFLQIGLALGMIWLMNLLFIVVDILKHASFGDDDEEGDKVVEKWMMNTPLERIQMIQNISNMQPFFGWGAIIFLLMAWIV